MQGQGQGQGQENTSNSDADNFGFNQLWFDQQNANSDREASVRNGHDSVNGTRQSSSSMINQNQISFVAFLNEVPDDRSGKGQRLEGIHTENGQAGEGNISSAPPNNINSDLNATSEGNTNELVPRMGVSLSTQPSKPDEPEADRNSPAIDSSNQLLISSGISCYVLEEDDSGQGDSSKVRRLTCRRTAPEGASRQLLLGGSSSAAQQATDSEQMDGIVQENTVISSASNNQANIKLQVSDVGAGVVGVAVGFGTGAASASSEIPNVIGTVLGAGHGAATVSNQSSSVAANGSLQGTLLMDQTSSVARNGLGPASGIGVASAMMRQASNRLRQSENFQRNIRPRRGTNQQDYLPASMLTPNNRNSHLQSPGQTAMFFQCDNFPNPSDTQRQEGNLINNPSDIFLNTGLKLGNLSDMSTHLNLSNGNTNLPANAAAASSSSRDGSNRIPSPPTRFANPIFNDRYPEAVADIAGSSESREQTNYLPSPAGAYPATREVENRPRPQPGWPRLMPRPEGETDADAFPMPAVSQPSAEDRPRLRPRGSRLGSRLMPRPDRETDADDFPTPAVLQPSAEDRPRLRPRRSRVMPRPERETDADAYPTPAVLQPSSEDRPRLRPRRSRRPERQTDTGDFPIPATVQPSSEDRPRLRPRRSRRPERQTDAGAYPLPSEDRPRLRPRRSRRPERQTGADASPMPAILRPSSPPRRINRQPSSQVQSTFAVVRRVGGGLRIENLDNMSENMRRIAEGITYEALVALREEIGRVKTGLNEEAILANLRQRKHQSLKDGSTDSENNETCCICQEEYVDGEDLGKLDCGHDFHVNCIKQWLVLKNQCPICKKIGLDGKQSPTLPSETRDLLATYDP